MMTTYEKFRRMTDNNIMLSFKGEITSDIITMVLQIAENKLDAAQEKGSVKKKIFNVLVECLQNLYHHAEKDTTVDDPQKAALLELWYEEDYYNILTGNYIKNENVENLKVRIDKVNSLSRDDLRRYYREILDNEQISDKGGADLGMIDMARKSGEKLSYNFEKINNELSFFDLLVRVSKKKEKN